MLKNFLIIKRYSILSLLCLFLCANLLIQNLIILSFLSLLLFYFISGKIDKHRDELTQFFEKPKQRQLLDPATSFYHENAKPDTKPPPPKNRVIKEGTQPKNDNQ